jgi:hypothetical protein
LLAVVDAQEAADPRFALSPQELGDLLGVKLGRVFQIIGALEVNTWIEGNRRKLAKPDAYKLLRKRIIDSNPPEGPVKVRMRAFARCTTRGRTP